VKKRQGGKDYLYRVANQRGLNVQAEDTIEDIAWSRLWKSMPKPQSPLKYSMAMW
jgi:hypothetical protein